MCTSGLSRTVLFVFLKFLDSASGFAKVGSAFALLEPRKLLCSIFLGTSYVEAALKV